MKKKLIDETTLTITREQAAALLSAVNVALDANGGEAPASVETPLYEIVERLNEAFDFGIAEQPK
jgi:hypothetical protein